VARATSVAPTGNEIRRAVEALRHGGLVAFPTETVYGLGADAGNEQAVLRLYRVKGRPLDHPVIVHLGDRAGLDDWGDDISDPARALADAFWPGPLTLVVTRRAGMGAPAVAAGLATVALRVPAQPVALALLRAFGGAIAAPSANRFGRVSPTTAEHVRADLGTDVDVVLDGGPCAIGVESTIVDCTDGGVRILRPGGVPREGVEAVLGRHVEIAAVSGGAPGTLPMHYAPDARVELVDADALTARRAALTAEGAHVVVLAGVDAAHLYARLRDADASGADVVLAVLPSEDGLGAAVADRLRRAAAASADPEGSPP
jgi:L-threonylcarbamoyladenylate synthase